MKSQVYTLIYKYYMNEDLPLTFYKHEGLSESQFYIWRQRYLRDHLLVAMSKPTRTPTCRPQSDSASGEPARACKQRFRTALCRTESLFLPYCTRVWSGV